MEQFSPSKWRQISRANAYALASARDAVADSGLDLSRNGTTLHDNIGVAIGAGMADLDEIHKTGLAFDAGETRRVSPYFVPKILTNLSAGHVAIEYGLAGPNHSVATACATGLHAIGDAYAFIRSGQADVMIAGATEACLSPIAVVGFSRLRALSTMAEDGRVSAASASRPFDATRDGFVMGEGAGIVILESLEHAQTRYAPNLYAEILGYGLSGDAHHLTYYIAGTCFDIL